MRRKDAETDAEAVTTVVDAWQGNGLGVMGPEATLSALERGQVDELLLSANVRALKPVQTFPDSSPSEEFVSATSTPGVDEHRQRLASELVTRAEQTAARVRLIEDPALLEPYGGVGARLRFRL
jgi:peptide subunit release factor 1 (eRF1)